MFPINEPRRHRGFTLVELMIVLGIVAVLVAMAVPAYRDYTIRSKVGECVNNASVAKVQISEFRQSLGAWPPDIGSAGLLGTGNSQFCNGFTAYDNTTGSFQIDVNEAAVDGVLTDPISPQLSPTSTAALIIDWNCSRGATPLSNVKYLPATCREASP